LLTVYWGLDVMSMIVIAARDAMGMAQIKAIIGHEPPFSALRKLESSGSMQAFATGLARGALIICVHLLVESRTMDYKHLRQRRIRTGRIRSSISPAIWAFCMC
jgi:hypothetical protein